MTLTFDVHTTHLSDQLNSRGAWAAEQFFAAHNTTAEAVHAEFMKMADGDPHDASLAELWTEAETAAYREMFGDDVNTWPDDVSLALI